MYRYNLFISLVATAFLAGCTSSKVNIEYYEPTWESLSRYGEAPEWFRDAKFGIWAHWGPQCQPQSGDWYARSMYIQGTREYNEHLEQYGHPSQFGFKDVINEWRAEKWNPEELMALYVQAGAKYFFALGNHHDNFDLWDSEHHPWNSVNLGPRKDILAGWKAAAEKYNLPLGVSIHSSHAWTWYETSRGSDSDGMYAGVSYDGWLTKEHGTGKWWDGYDPQQLYAQQHPLSEPDPGTHSPDSQWEWLHGAAIPTPEYMQNFIDRTLDMYDKYQPDIVYFDDTALPFWPVGDAGLRVAAHIYNSSLEKNNGEQRAVITGKVLNGEQKNAIVWDVERGAPDDIQATPWQTCTCIGGWHYNRHFYENDSYKSAAEVIRILIDVVSKNGNLLLSVPLRGDGTLDEKEIAILEGIASWMKVNGETIYGTRPWKIYGEGPVAETANPLNAQGFNEGSQTYSSRDIRFLTRGDKLFAHVMAWPDGQQVCIASLAAGSELHPEAIRQVSMVGYHGMLDFSRTQEGLVVEIPEDAARNDISFVLEII